MSRAITSLGIDLRLDKNRQIILEELKKVFPDVKFRVSSSRTTGTTPENSQFDSTPYTIVVSSRKDALTKRTSVPSWCSLTFTQNYVQETTPFNPITANVAYLNLTQIRNRIYGSPTLTA